MAIRQASDQTSLNNQLDLSSGGDIIELTGWSGGMSISNRNFGSVVTIRPAAGASITITDGCALSNCSRITIDGEFSGGTLRFFRSVPFVAGTANTNCVTIASDCSFITVTRCTIESTELTSGYYGGSTGIQCGNTSGVGSDNTIIEYCTFRYIEVSVAAINATNCIIRNNKFLERGHDAIRGPGDNSLVERNLISGRYRSGGVAPDDYHNDIIQVNHDVTNWTCRWNVFCPSGGDWTEGIFFGGDSKVRNGVKIYQNIVIGQDGLLISQKDSGNTDSNTEIYNNLTMSWDGNGSPRKTGYVSGWVGLTVYERNIEHHDDNPGQQGTNRIRLQNNGPGAWYWNDYYADMTQPWETTPALTPAMVQPVAGAVTDRNRAGATDTNTYGPFETIEEWTNAADWPFDVTPAEEPPAVARGKPLRFGASALRFGSTILHFRGAAGTADLVSRPLGPAGSADFRGSIDAGWSVVVGGTSPFAAPVVVDGERLEWTLGAAESQDPGVGAAAAANTTRVVTSIGNGDWSMTVKIDDHPTVMNSGDFMSVGFYVGNDGTPTQESMRIEEYVRDNQTGDPLYYIETPDNGALAGNGSANYGLQGPPTYMRLTKTGNNYDYLTSWDGVSFTSQRTWTDDMVVDTAGFYFAHSGTINRQGIGSIDYIHVDGHNKPSLGRAPTLTTQLAEGFTDLTNWNDDSINSATASVSGGVLTLSKTAADKSSARISSLTSYGPDVGVVFRWRKLPADAGDGNSFIAVGLRGSNETSAGRWGDQYAADRTVAYEGNHGSDLARILANYGHSAGNGRYRGEWYVGNTGVNPAAVWTWVRMEVIGPVIRYRTWADGNSEPSTWLLEDVADEMVRGSGLVGIAFSHNDGVGNARSAELTDLEIYSLS